MPAKHHQMTDRQMKIAALCDGETSSKEIAAYLGESAKYVQHTMKRWNLPRIKQGGATGKANGNYKHGRRIDRDGYALLTAPEDHPYARKRANRPSGLIYEHRLVMENHLGRYILPTETVDHIDGLRLHNAPSNLRLFSSNAEHLKKTTTGRIPAWSAEGLENMRKANRCGLVGQRVHTYEKMKKSGDARLREILLAALQLGADSPFLLGTSHHLEKAGISDLSRSNLILELEKLSQKYA